MIDAQSLQSLIEDQIKTLVNARIDQIIADGQWVMDMESQIVKHVQDRLTARFNNISTMPDLVETVKNNISSLIDQGRVPGLKEFVDEKQLQLFVDNGVQKMVNDAINNLTLDSSWVQKIETQIDQTFVRRISQELNGFDFNKIVKEQIDANIDNWYDKLRAKFETTGIIDTATQRQLTVMDGVVVAEEQIAASSLMIEKDAEIKGTLKVEKLAINSAINANNRVWNELAETVANITEKRLDTVWKKDLAEGVLELAKDSGIEFSHVMLDGKKLISNGTLSDAVTDSSLTTVGALKNLTVRGEANIFDTFNVSGKRVGINTQQPDMALGIWDEEVSISMGKIAQKKAFIGSTRDQSLAIGVNKREDIVIGNNGETTIKQLRVGQFRIGHSSEVPGHSGSRGDLMFNSDPKPGQPFAWVCLGAFKWQPIKGA